MIYTNRVFKAINIAYKAHEGQVDKSGIPYIFHPMHLAEQMDTEEECIVAILHDVVEDTDITFQQLEKEFSETIIEALKLLTREKEIDYIEYIRKLKINQLAKKVKIADLIHNCDETRLIKLTEKDKIRNKKYRLALEILRK